jgi:O-antigen/teichoic acid export membrane protein
VVCNIFYPPGEAGHLDTSKSRRYRDWNEMTEPGIPSYDTQVLLESPRGIVNQASWTVLDQALLALANFGGNIVLARWLAPVEYGGYMAASALFWMTLNIHGGLLSEPMTVFGSGRFRERLSSYFAILASFHWGISAMLSAGLVAVGLALILWGSTASGLSILGYALSAPLVLLLQLVRRTVYLCSHPRLAAAAAGIYMVGMFTIMYFLYCTATLSSFTAPLAAAGASALAVAAIIAMRGFPLWSSWQGDFVRQVVASHWRYGRWAVVVGIVSWAPTGVVYLLIVPVLVGLEANAALNALWNFVMPVIHLSLAVGLLLVPAFGRARSDRRAASVMWIALLALVSGATLYALVVGLFGGPVMDLVYGGRYTQYAHLAWLVGLAALPTAAATVFGSVLRAYERPDRILWAHMASAAVTCAFGTVAVATWGVLGGILVLLARDMTTMLGELWWVLRTVGSHEPCMAPKPPLREQR